MQGGSFLLVDFADMVYEKGGYLQKMQITAFKVI